jgi:RNA polymerase sigma factor (sigma-70 family)
MHVSQQAQVIDWRLWWFSSLEAAIERGDYIAAAEARRELERLGVSVAYRGRESLDGWAELLFPVAARLIRWKARQLAGKPGFIRSDQADIEQELTLKFLNSAASFEPERGRWKGFVTKVVERHAASLLRNSRAKKRAHRRITSLNSPVQAGSDIPTTLADSITDRDQDARRGRRPRSEEQISRLAFDLAEVLERLPPKLRDLAERLKTQSIAEAARTLGVPRTTVNGWVSQLRRRFEKAGLRAYMESSSSPWRRTG